MSPVAETTRITDLFLLLGEDQALLTEFERDPEGLLATSGLDAAAVATVLSGDSDAVRAAVEGEVESDPARRHHVVRPRMCVIAPGEGDEGDADDSDADDSDADDADADDGDADEGDSAHDRFTHAARG